MLSLSRNDKSSLLYLLKIHNFLSDSNQHEVQINQGHELKETMFFGQKTVLDLSQESRWLCTTY